MPRLDNSASLDLVSLSASTIYNQPNVGTTPLVLAAVPSAFSPYGLGIRRIQMTNRHASGYVAFLLTTAVSPTISCSSFGGIGATEGIHVGPGASYFVNCKADLSLWFVANIASVPFQVVAYDCKA